MSDLLCFNALILSYMRQHLHNDNIVSILRGKLLYEKNAI